MQVNNENNAGYKHTLLGWIPNEWEIKQLHTITDNFKSGEGITSPQIFDEGDFPVYGGNGLRGFANSYTHDGEYILIGRQGALCGNIVMVKGKIYISEHAIAVSVNGKTDLNWLGYCLIHKNLNRLSESSAQPGLAVNKLLKLKVTFPPLPEQRRIAAILSTWDEAITKTQQLIAQLQQRNKGLMQQLLTGKKRLKGFNGKWMHLKIYDVAKEVSLKNREDKQLTVLSCTKYDGLVPSLEYFGRRVFGSDTSTYKVVPKAHFAYATNHIEEGSIGYQNILEEALISPMYTVFKTSDKVNDDFFYKLLKSHQYIHQYCKRMEGSIDRRGGLRWDEFSKIVIHLPQLEEQKAIASLINKAVEEVKLYKQKLAALQQQKKGLMQKLLTGEIRVNTKNN